MAAGGGGPAASPMTTPSWAVRIRGADGEIAGAGILLTPEWVLTCAHVVDRTADAMTAEFVGAVGHGVPAVPARPERDAYVPETLDADGDPSGDVALLRLERPRPVEETVRLHRLSAPNREVRMYGFPYQHNGGIWFRATAVGVCGRDGQVQLIPASPGELASPGCSGAGVADSDTGEVIGMVLSGQEDRHGNRFSFMSPVETIVRHLPRLDLVTTGPSAVDPQLRSTAEDILPELLDRPFAQRLAAWLRDDGSQVKISVVRHGDAAREATLRRAITLADRELRTPVSVDRASLDPPGTVPSAGGHDLAVYAEGRTSAGIAERIAERLGLPRHPEEAPLDRIRAARTSLNLVVVGVDEAVDPLGVLDLLDVLRADGSRLLLVLRTAGDCHRRAREQLLTGPARGRRARLVERLKEITGPRAEDLRERLAAVVPQGVRPLDSDLVAAHAALADLLRAAGEADHDGGGLGDPAPGPGPDLARYERLADRVEGRLAAAVAALDRLRDRRDELAGRLRSYQVLHQHSLRGEEDPVVDGLYLRAHTLLRARPCDVRTAEAAVDAYTRRVDGHSEGDGPGAGSGHGAGDSRGAGGGYGSGDGHGAGDGPGAQAGYGSGGGRGDQDAYEARDGLGGGDGPAARDDYGAWGGHEAADGHGAGGGGGHGAGHGHAARDGRGAPDGRGAGNGRGAGGSRGAGGGRGAGDGCGGGDGRGGGDAS
ncbi:serine protease [Streptomyces sp. CB09001]|uniref:S1 family peptidase n=1 Tax=Streptomyces sp. CB09001 TaxID=2083284 RepID=UPI000E2122D7|nr:serine protease [Streptomyces sp. CB09001]AXL87582.1 serine protease [Streptomyces sp. CB09001]